MAEENVLGPHRMSNLLSLKPTPHNSSYKDNQARVRGSFFAQMLQNIKGNSYSRERAHQREEQQESHQQNLAILIEAKNLKHVQNSSEFFSFQPHRNLSGGSKTFLIRPQPKKSHCTENSSAKDLQNPKNFLEIETHLEPFNSTSFRQIAQPTQYLSRKEYLSSPLSNGVIIPFKLLKKCATAYSKLLYSLIENGIQVYIVVVRKEEYAKALESTLSKFCHILFCHLKDKPEQNCFMNLEDIPNLPQNLLIFQSLDYPFTKIFPYFGEISPQKRSAFIKVREFSRIKNIHFTQDQKVCIKSDMTSHPKKKTKPVQTFDLKSVVQMEFECLQRKKRRRKTKNLNALKQGIDDKNLENLQEKLLQYVKIVKNESQENGTKESYGKQCSKSSFQVINQLIRANVGIHKQIQQFVGEQKYHYRNQGCSCDPIIYHILQ